ncbi:unnamed protein product (macronuclear) [Paramecium tetraurelia]|uniref:Uncharacterized protein n=1 Tax=Paramecium tetraurelia TaxID=5888 RepID=A0BE93_PARTE|nr:uncharacterized protein GSPATT00027893001 [Paramecium tetraurelia]CAK56860.1 unnamed protein product [Paramecium tetraurelia]|eukprot:XP_001424258.1 hypothetical protein (macronuclear) [Paramecium tetraurelia strain d4-2]
MQSTKKMKSYIEDQDMEMKSLKAQQISSITFKMYCLILSKNFSVNQEEYIRKSEFPQTKSISNLKIQNRNCSSSDFGSEEQGVKLSYKEMKTQNHILELLETYNQQSKEREQQNKLIMFNFMIQNIIKKQ